MDSGQEQGVQHKLLTVPAENAKLDLWGRAGLGVGRRKKRSDLKGDQLNGKKREQEGNEGDREEKERLRGDDRCGRWQCYREGEGWSTQPVRTK